jgi:hypothetical protein
VYFRNAPEFYYGTFPQPQHNVLRHIRGSREPGVPLRGAGQIPAMLCLGILCFLGAQRFSVKKVTEEAEVTIFHRRLDMSRVIAISLSVSSILAGMV